MLAPGSHPAISLTPAFAYFARGAGSGPDITREAYGRFVGALGLGGADPGSDVQLAFMSWFVLEHRLQSGKTPLEHYVLCAPRRTGQERMQLEVLRQVAQTQRFGLFWVREADTSLGTLRLEDALDGSAFTVHDRARAVQVADAPGFERGVGHEGRANLLAAHVARVADEWRLPVGILAIRCDVDEAAFGSSLKQAQAAGQQIGFMDMAIAEFGKPGVSVARPADGTAPGSVGASGEKAGDVALAGAVTSATTDDVVPAGAATGEGLSAVAPAGVVSSARADDVVPADAVTSEEAGKAAPAGAATGEELNAVASAADDTRPFWELPKGAPAHAAGPASEPARPNRPAPRVILDGPASEVPGMTVPPERREGALIDAAHLYGLLARDFSLTPTWADIVEAVRTRADGEEAGDVVRRLFGPNAEALSQFDDAAFEDLLYCVILAWNLLPHDVFDGKSPAEIYNGR